MRSTKLSKGREKKVKSLQKREGQLMAKDRKDKFWQKERKLTDGKRKEGQIMAKERTLN